MTALWFEKQEKIKAGEVSLEAFINDINKDIAKNISSPQTNLNFTEQKEETAEITCPVCGKGQLRRWKHKEKGYYYWSCSAWKETGCKAFFLDNKGKPKIEKDDEILCPVCKKGKLRRLQSKDKKYYYWNCSAWKETGCKAFYYDSKGKPDISK